MHSNRVFLVRLLFSLYLFSVLSPALSQDSNILHPIPDIERWLKHDSFDIFRIRGSRWKDDLTRRVIVRYSDGTPIQVKWKTAAHGGWGENNEPRYEIAAYELQKLFLEPEEFVVPPTSVRCLPLQQYRQIDKNIEPTFKNTSAVFFCLQYWLEEVGTEKVYDKKRFKKDPVYARHLGNMNILSYLIDHKDANIGNFLISTDPENPRVFAVDNSLAFSSLESNRGTEWRKIRVKKLPGDTVEKLRSIEKEDLQTTLGVVAQFEIKEDQPVLVEKSDNLNPKKGVRKSDEIIQFGLTTREISGVHRRLKALLKRIDSGKIKTF
ncbi:MAG: hypothetical protein ACE5IR_11035 [bacterium]